MGVAVVRYAGQGMQDSAGTQIVGCRALVKQSPQEDIPRLIINTDICDTRAQDLNVHAKFGEYTAWCGTTHTRFLLIIRVIRW